MTAQARAGGVGTGEHGGQWRVDPHADEGGWSAKTDASARSAAVDDDATATRCGRTAPSGDGYASAPNQCSSGISAHLTLLCSASADYCAREHGQR